MQYDSGDEPLTARERAAVIHRIRSLVEYWGITHEELVSDAPYVPPPVLPVANAPIKYRHPKTGETWDGQGAHPQWLRDALLKQGFTVDELKPDSPLQFAALASHPVGALEAAAELPIEPPTDPPPVVEV